MSDAALHRVSSGIEGLDEILDGGPLACRRYLVRGGPGQGKTTLGLSFLAAADGGESSLFIGFQEPEDQIRANAASVGIDVSGIRFLSLAPDEQFFTQHEAYDVFAASDVEQGPVVEAVIQAVEEEEPARVFVDSLTQLRFLSADVFQYRKQILSFLRFLTERGATVLFSSESSVEFPDDDLQFVADGVITLDSGVFGGVVSVSKFRGSGYQPGRHQVRLDGRGLQIFPRLVPPSGRRVEAGNILWASGEAELDRMLHGGLEAGTVSLITGPTGIGKSTLAALFAVRAAGRGHRAAAFLFEEEVVAYLGRLRSLGVPVDTPWERGDFLLELVEPMRYLADEFAAHVRRLVEHDGVSMVVLDSISGFELALESEDIKARLHAFAKTLARLGASVILVNETEAMASEFRVSEKDISYLADNVVYLQYVRDDGAINKTIGVLKKRLTGFDPSVRRLDIGPVGMRIGESVSGVPAGTAGDGAAGDEP